MKVNPVMLPDGSIRFDSFTVRREKDSFYGVYSNYDRSIVTSGKTLNDACKKAKMLQIGYNLGYSNAREDYW